MAEAPIEILSTEFEELQAEMESLKRHLTAIDERVPAYSVDGRFEDVQEELETVRRFGKSLKNAFK